MTAVAAKRAANTQQDFMVQDQKSLLRDRALIEGRWVAASDGRTFSVTNPATTERIADLPDLGEVEIDTAIGAAADAFSSWSAMLPQERSQLMTSWAALIEDNADDLGRLMTAEQGKPLAEAVGEIKGSAATIRWCAEEGRRLYGEFIDGHKPSTKIIVSRHPAGVVGAITPWNFPASMITRKVGPALAAGCTVVLKPATATPLSALALGFLAMEAGIPAGVLNIVTSKDAKMVGRKLTGDSRVRKISFTGSTDVGKTLMVQAAGQVQKISLELGGNAPFIVFPSSPLDKAVKGAIDSKFRNAGQTCICANRIYVHDQIFDRFVIEFSNAVRQLTVGDGLDDGVRIGPLINMAAVEKIEELIEDATSRGATILAGGRRHKRGGTFFEPTILAGAPDDSKIAQEEIFGPIAVLYRFTDEDEVVRRANDTVFGLSAYLYTEDLGQALRVSERLQSGMVAVNEPLLASDLAPFGGVKQSGIGREGGQYGLLEYVDIKYRLIRV